MFRRFALGLVVVIAVLGIIFAGLDIFDIEEDFRLHWPLAILNTAFISAVAVPVACIAAKHFTITGSPVTLWLGCGAIAFGVGSLLKGWLIGISLGVLITVDESAALIASVLHLIGASLGMAKMRLPNSEFRRKSGIILGYYLGVIACIALAILLVIQGVIPSFHVPGEGSGVLRVVVRGITAILFVAAAVINLITYYKSHTDSYYWYSLGLALFGFGVFFISLGAVESRVAWLGRTAHYVGSIYFLVSVLGAYRLASTRKVGVSPTG